MPRFLPVLLSINAAIALANAMVALSAPGTSLSLYGVDGGSDAQLMARFAAVGSVAIGLLAWFARRVEPGPALRRIILALLASDLVGLIVSVHGSLSAAMNAAGWGLALVYAIFATGYAVFLMRGPAASPKPATGQVGPGGRSAGPDG